MCVWAMARSVGGTNPGRTNRKFEISFKAGAERLANTRSTTRRIISVSLLLIFRNVHAATPARILLTSGNCSITAQKDQPRIQIRWIMRYGMIIIAQLQNYYCAASEECGVLPNAPHTNYSASIAHHCCIYIGACLVYGVEFVKAIICKKAVVHARQQLHRPASKSCKLLQ
jgi:hypothetical protein